eukprot:CAMPEP_0171344172 /NCGR_PEP_ID=MMETSP0878-20121228/18816_1 /TAXON_ID=67004 /ORGANISM="Thalassiosira weissflogii, Strain CCMP1336" /LENGTH=458 /DNA_ID=CAMNT_0011847297 /DNA_START=21 /DNA_END=1397 /DNA_ORIENTATION=+
MAKATRRRKEQSANSNDGHTNKDDGQSNTNTNTPPSSSRPPEHRRDKTSKTSATSSSPTTSPSQPKHPDDMTLLEVFLSHPLVKVGKFFLLPYLLYLSYYSLLLQHPHHLSTLTLNILSPRPAVGVHSPRQLLIVAPPSSGTVQIQKELKNKLHLEMGHETSDTAWNFVRDGTVSWFHGIRFLSSPPSNEDLVRSFTAICGNYTENMGFHPAAYRVPENRCSYRSKWDDCWRKECYAILIEEWGCATRGNCEIGFRTTLHQVRNPMRTLESLAVKFCVGGLDSGVVREEFLVYARAMFSKGHDFGRYSCIEAVGYFLVEYQNVMIEARKRGEIAGFYRIEDTSACDVAEMAGFLDEDRVVYKPNYGKIKKICGNGDDGVPAKRVVEQKENRLNKDMVKLSWKDLRGGIHASRKDVGDRDLEMKVRGLFRAFGYDEKQIEEEIIMAQDGKVGESPGNEL